VDAVDSSGGAWIVRREEMISVVDGWAYTIASIHIRGTDDGRCGGGRSAASRVRIPTAQGDQGDQGVPPYCSSQGRSLYVSSSHLVLCCWEE